MNTRTTRTTTLEITPPESFEALEAAFELYRYVLPPDLKERTGKIDAFYARFHNHLKKVIPFPYKLYTYAQSGWVVFVLAPKNEVLKDLEHDDWFRFPVKPEALTFREMWDTSWFNLIKLLQIAYFGSMKDDHFVGRDDCFVYARKDPRSKYRHICLKLEISGRIEDNNYVCYVKDSATTFRPPEKKDFNGETYYGMSFRNGQTYFHQLKLSVVSLNRVGGYGYSHKNLPNGPDMVSNACRHSG